MATWVVFAGALAVGPAAAAVVGAGVAVAGTGVAAAMALRRGAPAVLAVAGCAAAAGVLAAAQALALLGHPVRAGAERGAAATLRVVVADDPRTIRGGLMRGAPQVSVPARLVRAEVEAGTWQVGGRVLLIATAGSWAGLLPGQEVTADGLLTPALRPDLTVAVLRVRGPPREVGAPPWWQSAAGALRAGLRDAAAQMLEPAAAGLLPGLVVGDTSGVPDEVDADFRTAGLTHLLAVSGSNVAVLTGGLLWLLRRVRADPRLTAAVGGLAVVGFVVLARPSPSVLRAAVMAGIALLALGAGRSRAAVPALAATVLVLLPADPALALDAGFALSVSATAALVLLAPGWAAALRRRRVPGWCAEALAVPAAACVVTAPLVAGLSGQISLVAVLANLLAVPAVAPATVLGVVAAVVSPVAPPVAQACVAVAGPAVTWLLVVADRTAAIDGATVAWPAGPGGALLLTALVIGVLVAMRVRRVRALLVAVALGLAVVLVPTRVQPPGWPPAGWAAAVCDVGQGDAVVLATGKEGNAVLVDTGPEDGLVDACLRRLGVRTLALVVLTHLHADHIGGLAGALRGRAVGAVAVGPGREPAWAWLDVVAAAGAAGAPLVGLPLGQHLGWPALALDVLGPVHPAVFVDGGDGTAVNDISVVLRARTPAGTVLLTGDVELAAQADLLASGAELHADVLKLPHHGSRSTSVAFLGAVGARAVLVSVGAGNSYGHPNAALLAALERGGAMVRRTDLAGDLAVAAAGALSDVAAAGAPPDVAVVARGSPLPARR